MEYRWLCLTKQCMSTQREYDIIATVGSEYFIAIFCRYRLYETVYNKKDSRFGPSPLFGANCGVLQTGTLSVGDIVTVQSLAFVNIMTVIANMESDS